MQSTNPKSLRADMKFFLDLAKNEPLRVLRRNGDAYVLVSEDLFDLHQQKVRNLREELLQLHGPRLESSQHL